MTVAEVDPRTLRRGRPKPGEVPIVLDEMVRVAEQLDRVLKSGMLARQFRTTGWLVDLARRGETIVIREGNVETRTFPDPSEILYVGKPCKWSEEWHRGLRYLRLTTKLLIR